MKSFLRIPVLAACSALCLEAGARAAEESLQIDGVHSTMVFKIKHLGTANFYGRFNDISGKLVLGSGDPAKDSMEVQVKAESVDTGNEKRDQHLKGPDFFNAKQFPAIAFKSKAVKADGDKGYQVNGELTLHGVTKPLEVKVERVGSSKDARMGERSGFETTFTIKRSDYGMKTMVGPLGDEVQITLSVEAVKK